MERDTEREEEEGLQSARKQSDNDKASDSELVPYAVMYFEEFS